MGDPATTYLVHRLDTFAPGPHLHSVTDADGRQVFTIGGLLWDATLLDTSDALLYQSRRANRIAGHEYEITDADGAAVAGVHRRRPSWTQVRFTVDLGDSVTLDLISGARQLDYALTDPDGAPLGHYLRDKMGADDYRVEVYDEERTTLVLAIGLALHDAISCRREY